MLRVFKGLRLRQRGCSSALAMCVFVAALGCAREGEEGIAPPLDQLYNPVGISAHPNGRYLLVSSAVFDRSYNASSVVVVDTYEERVIPEAGVKIDLFSGELEIAEVCPPEQAAQGLCRSRLIGIIPSRDQGTLTTFELTETEEGEPRILCDQDESRRCRGKFVQSSRPEGNFRDGPFSLSIDEAGLFLSHINSGQLSRWRFTDDAPYLQRQCEVQLPGANFVTQNPATGMAIVSDLFGRGLYRAEQRSLSSGGCIFDIQTSINTTYSMFQTEGRGVAMSADGTLLYAVNSSEAILRVYAMNQGMNLVASIPVGREASVVRVAGLRPDEYRPTIRLNDAVNEEIDRLGEGLVYVTSFADQLVTVIDPVSLSVIGTIEVGDGPHHIDFMLNEAGELRGYVTLFNDHAIGVIDLDPRSPKRFTKLGDIR